MNYTVKMEIEITVNSDNGKDAREYASDVIKSLGIDCVKVLSAERVYEGKVKADAVWVCDDGYIENALIEHVDNLEKEMVGDV